MINERKKADLLKGKAGKTSFTSFKPGNMRGNLRRGIR